MLALAAALPAAAQDRSATPRGLADAPVDGDLLEEAYEPRRVAVLVGVDDYDDGAFPRLRFAADDAMAVAEVLHDTMFGGFDELVLLTGRDETGRADILATLDDIAATLHRNDTFVFYFSGHGTLSTDDSGRTSLYLCTRDTDADRPQSTALRVDLLQRFFKNRVHCRRKVMVLDSCHNGEAKSFVDDGTRERMARRRSPLDPAILTRVGEAEAHLFAAAFHQPALEDPELGHGVYTWFLLQALGERGPLADLDGDGVISVIEAHQYARDHTIAHTGGAQVPQAMFREVGREEIFLSGGEGALLAAERGLLTSYSRLLADCQIHVDGVPRGMLPKALPVEPGVHHVEVVEPSTGRVVVQRAVRIGPGQALSVDALADERRPEKSASLAAGASLFGVAGPYGDSYPALSVGPDLSLRWRFHGPARNVRLTVDLSSGHGEGTYVAAYDVPVAAHMVRLGGGVQACADVRRASFWIGPRMQLIGVSIQRLDDEVAAQAALTPAGGLRAGVDLWGNDRVGVQLAAYVDVFAPVVRDRLDNPETRFGVLLGGQVRVLGVLR